MPDRAGSVVTCMLLLVTAAIAETRTRTCLRQQVATAALGLREHYSLAQPAAQAASLDF